MAFYKPQSNLAKRILAFISHMVSKTMYNEIKDILEPCCKPSFTFDTYQCNSTNAGWGIRFLNVTISFPKFAGQTVTVLLTDDSAAGGGVINTITLDSDGNWNGYLQSSWWNSDGTQTITPYIISSTSRLLYAGETQTLSGLPNCD